MTDAPHKPPAQRSKVRIKDVALEAGVSVGTVSHYLNGRFVSEERSRRIRKAIDDLGFTSNLLARGMRRQSSSVIGLCVPFTIFSNFSQLVNALEERVSDANYELMQVLSRQDPGKEFRRIRKLVDFRVDGLLLVPSLEPQDMLDHLHKSGVPTVILNRLMPDEHRFDQVALDHEKIMYEVAREFIRRGHRHLLFFVHWPALIVTQLRIEGLRRAIRDSGEDVRFEVLACGAHEHQFDAQFGAALDAGPRPTGIILSNSRIAAWTLKSLRRRGIDYPASMSVLTLDNPDWADVVVPGISHVAQPSDEISARAWQLLSERIEGSAKPPQRILVDAEIRYLDF
ncbi:LacI family DNA-binding transcriptional regulator [Microbaculum marinum]|uniref:LacI family DNA-binding transcriptional regulator n=1 Tax=Microbaculum marinum TaxID=1764581 RepID=A0AAW9RM96_9HYPH